MTQARESPEIDPRQLVGLAPEQIDEIARSAGLIPRGPDAMRGKGAYVDPVSGAQRILIHPADREFHVNSPNGERLDIDGNVVDPKSPLAHLPLRQPGQPLP